MANISAALVKELRERTAAGMMDCKKALTEANGDIELAIEKDSIQVTPVDISDLFAVEVDFEGDLERANAR